MMRYVFLSLRSDGFSELIVGCLRVMWRAE